VPHSSTLSDPASQRHNSNRFRKRHLVQFTVAISLHYYFLLCEAGNYYRAIAATFNRFVANRKHCESSHFPNPLFVLPHNFFNSGNGSKFKPLLLQTIETSKKVKPQKGRRSSIYVTDSQSTHGCHQQLPSNIYFTPSPISHSLLRF